MNFADKLKTLMKELNLSQAKLSALTGIGKSSISQYISGKNEPTKDRKRGIARALGVKEDYFETFEPIEGFETISVKDNEVVNVPVKLAAKLMRKSKEWVMKGLQDGTFMWGNAVLMKSGKWSYWISSVKFTEYTGIEVPMNEVA